MLRRFTWLNIHRLSIVFVLLILAIPSASAYDKVFYEDNKTLHIKQVNTNKTLFTIQQVSVSQGLTSFEEVFNITSYLASDYTFSSSDVSFSWKRFKGNNNITNADFFLFKPSNYSVLVDDYGINRTYRSKEVYNNQTGLNDTVWYWDNKTVVVGNHTEIRDNSTWLKLNNLNGKVIKSGKSYIIKTVFTKKFEKEFSIKLTPSFLGVPEDKMTWWNGSYSKTPLLINNTGNASSQTDFQVFVNITYNATYMDTNFTSFHLVNETLGQEMVGRFWIERSNSLNGSYANIWLNLSSIPASSWDNITFALYHRNQTEVDGSNGTGTFIQGTDYSSSAGWSLGTGWSVSNGLLSSGTSNAGSSSTTPVTESKYVVMARVRGTVTNFRIFMGAESNTPFDGTSETGSTLYSYGSYSNTLMRYNNGYVIASTATSFSVVNGVWNVLEIKINEGVNYTSIASTNNRVTTASTGHSVKGTGTGNTLGFFAAGSENYDVDWLYARKTTGEVDPIAQAGAAEAPPSEYVEADQSQVWWIW